MPAPRSPISAMRWLRSAFWPPVPNISPSATRARRSAASSLCSSSSRISSHSGEEVVTSPIRSASVQCSAPATCSSTRIETLPTPYSRFARWRSDTSAAIATARRVRPRRARRLRARSPSATRNGFFSPCPAPPSCGRSIVDDASLSRCEDRGGAGVCSIVLDMPETRDYRSVESTILHTLSRSNPDPPPPAIQSSQKRDRHEPEHRHAAGRRLQLRAVPDRVQRGPRREDRLHRRPGTPQLRRTRRPRPAPRSGAAGDRACGARNACCC